ncbi:hypothetical protein [Kitasatospora aureofaciens]|uniref:hypothetical protein n=1 Tax=Streptomyces phage mu1/6 TaxID=370623 RepID=UPI0000D4F6C0|nr:hypothetical protein SPMV1_gp18 [Streptomyces phage mu1/6]ABD94183.1 unknown [Streptomyces phage mu1/6]
MTTATGWVGGLTIRCGPGTPTADYLCTACWHHIRIVGRDHVKYGARDLPITHRATCPATPKENPQ